MLKLHFLAQIPRESFIKDGRSRILGPDTHGAYVRVTEVRHEPCRTVVRCRPITHEMMLAMTIDEHDQYWLPLPEEPQ